MVVMNAFISFDMIFRRARRRALRVLDQSLLLGRELLLGLFRWEWLVWDREFLRFCNGFKDWDRVYEMRENGPRVHYGNDKMKRIRMASPRIERHENGW